MNNTKIFSLKLKNGKTLELGKKTCIMGVLNITPDSFSDGGKFFDNKKAVEHGLQLQNEGADILDIGGESSRPGAARVTAEEEISRVEPIIKELVAILNIPISIDTYKAKVAYRALELGASIVNDISAMRFDKNMAKVVSESQVPVILMHIQGNPQTMQTNPHYDCLLDEIKLYLKESADIAQKAGVKPENIIIDPGIGFGKTQSNNLEILKHLDTFKSLGYPILIGTSRKSFIGNILNLPSEKRIFGTAATIAISIMNGANIIRVHDVDEMKQVAQISDAIINMN